MPHRVNNFESYSVHRTEHRFERVHWYLLDKNNASLLSYLGREVASMAIVNEGRIAPSCMWSNASLLSFLGRECASMAIVI